MSSRFILPFADVGSGIKPSSGAQLFFFETGTSTPKDTFSDQLSTPTTNTNPVIADSTGLFGDIFITGKYKVVLKNKNGSQIWSADPVEEFAVGNLIDDIINDLSQAYEFATVAAFKASSIEFPDGKTIRLLDRGADFTKISGQSGTGRGTIPSTSVNQSIVVITQKGFVRSAAFGVLADGVTDSTQAVQESLDRLDSTGGGTLTNPNGTILISIAESVNVNACILIPKNTTFIGGGSKATTFTRPASERGVIGVLFVNKNWDLNGTQGNYSADGNIIFRHLGITDGDITPFRANGDLIGFGNGDGLLVEHCFFGNHDQHAVDICKSRNVIIRNNENDNRVDQPTTNIYQIDAGGTVGILGIAGAGTPHATYNVKIYENNIIHSRAEPIIQFHSENESKNIFIFRNTIDGSALTGGRGGIGGDADCSYDNVHIYENEITLASEETYGIFLPIDETKVCKGLKIYNNNISGLFRIAAYAGATGTSDDFSLVNLHDVEITDNIANLDVTASNTQGTKIFGSGSFKYTLISGNKLYCTNTLQLGRVFYGIVDDNNQNAVIKDNELYRLDFGDMTSNVALNCEVIRSDKETFVAQDIPCYLEITGNNIDWNGCTFHIRFRDSGLAVTDYTKCTGMIARNYMKGVFSTLHSNAVNMFLMLDLSDGTNNLGFVDFEGQSFTNAQNIMQIFSGTLYTGIKLTGTKNAKEAFRLGNTRLDIIYTQSSTTGFRHQTQTVNTVYISSTESAGTNVRDVDVENGVFEVLTGTNGVTMSISDTTFMPVFHASGFIKIQCGI